MPVLVVPWEEYLHGQAVWVWGLMLLHGEHVQSLIKCTRNRNQICDMTLSFYKIFLVIAIGCIAIILLRRKVGWHHNLLVTSKGREKLDRRDIILLFSAVCFFVLSACSFVFFDS